VNDFLIALVVCWLFFAPSTYREVRAGGWNAVGSVVVSLLLAVVLAVVVQFSLALKHALYSPTRQ